MSLFEGLFGDWQLRTATPCLEQNQEVTVVVTNYDQETGTAVVRIGDSRLRIKDTQPDIVDMTVRIRVTDFDANEHTGTAELLEITGETMY
jgi:ABC-type molybdate transport system ATPase subunit